MANTNPKKSKWGIGIFALYGGFVVFILICVAFASMQSFDLVAPDYYQKGIEYQSQIDKLNRTAESGETPSIGFNAQSQGVIITFPSAVKPKQVRGTITLFRPSNANWDKTVPINLGSDGKQLIEASMLAKGRWRVKIEWTTGDQSYYAEDFLDLE